MRSIQHSLYLAAAILNRAGEEDVRRLIIVRRYRRKFISRSPGNNLNAMRLSRQLIIKCGVRLTGELLFGLRVRFICGVRRFARALWKMFSQIV